MDDVTRLPREARSSRTLTSSGADRARPSAAASIVLLLAIAGLSVSGLYASRGAEPLFGRSLFD